MLKFEKKKIHSRTFFFFFFGSVQLNDVSLNSFSVVYSAKRYILCTGITVGTEGVNQGRAADHLRVVLPPWARVGGDVLFQLKPWGLF